MNDVSIEIDDVQKMFDDLAGLTKADVLMKALKAGAEVLRKATEGNLVVKNPGGQRILNKNPKAIGLRVDKFAQEVRVSITNKDDFRLHFLENGTVERYYLRKENGKSIKNAKARQNGMDLTKGAYRGKVTGTHFFKEAREQKADEVLRKICEEIVAEIEKITK